MATSAASIAFWNKHQVAHFGPDVTAEESLAAMEARNAMYPGLLDLMPTSFPGKLILDYGCGPGHDTIGFLLNGAKHVYALDTSLQGLNSLHHRLKAHDLEDRCTLIKVARYTSMPWVEHVHCAGVLHHLATPSRALTRMRAAVYKRGEIRLMVYDRGSQFVQELCGGSLETFAATVDHGAPIINAFTREEVSELAARAGLSCEYVGSYRVPDETEGPGLSACYSLRAR